MDAHLANSRLVGQSVVMKFGYKLLAVLFSVYTLLLTLLVLGDGSSEVLTRLGALGTIMTMGVLALAAVEKANAVRVAVPEAHEPKESKGTGLVARLERLAKLRAQGFLTKSEFRDAKARTLRE